MADTPMKPYYDEDGITIYHGDCREVLPLPADVIITDPPYGMGHYETDVNVDVLILLAMATVERVAIFGYPKRLIQFCVENRWVPDEWITWWASNASIKAFNLHGLAPEAECIAIRGPDHFKGLRQPRTATVKTNYVVREPLRTIERDPTTRRLGDVWIDASPGVGFNFAKRLHPNEKPLSLIRRLVEGLTSDDETILDPFMGSGTTLRAAKDLGRRAIGIEIEERYCEVAVQRLAQQVLTLG